MSTLPDRGFERPQRRPAPPPRHVERQRKLSTKTKAALVALAVLTVIVAIFAVVSCSNSGELASSGPSKTISADNAPQQTAEVDNVNAPTSVTVRKADGSTTKVKLDSVTKWTPITSEDCKDGEFVYYGNKAPPGTFAMGPEQRFGTAEKAMERTKEKACFDRLWLAMQNEFHANEAAMDLDLAQDNANKIVANNDEWAKAVNQLSGDIQWIGLANVELPYESLGNVPAADGKSMPSLTKWSNQPVMGETVVVVLKNGETRLNRGFCDEQPSVVTFTKVKVSTPNTVVKPPPSTIVKPPPSCVGCVITTPPPPPGCEGPGCCDHCVTTTPPPPPPPCTCDHPCGNVPPPEECNPPECPNGICPKDPGTAPGNGGPGTGGSTEYGGGPRPTTPKPETTWTPRPETYTPPPPPAETTAAPAPTRTVTPAPVEQQPTVELPQQPTRTEAVEVPTNANQCADPVLCG